MEPIVAVIVAALDLGQQPTAVRLAGSTAILVAVVAARFPKTVRSALTVG